ncbi:MAG: ferritin-like domain-containing protein [Pseudomonadota bacterium]
MREDRPAYVPFDPISKAGLIDACCHILGNTCRIARIALSYQWNVAGPGALQAEASFRDQSEELHGALAPIAEHIRSLGGAAILDYSDDTVMADIPTPSDLPDLLEMFQVMVDCHREACISIEAAIDIAEEAADRPGIRLLTDRLAAHRRHAWRAQMSEGDAPVQVAMTEQRQTLRITRAQQD